MTEENCYVERLSHPVEDALRLYDPPKAISHHHAKIGYVGEFTTFHLSTISENSHDRYTILSPTPSFDTYI